MMAKKKKPGIVGYPPLPTTEEVLGEVEREQDWREEARAEAKAAREQRQKEGEEHREAKRLTALRNTRRPRPTWAIELTEQVSLPIEFAAAFATGRSMLLQPFNRALSLEESKALANAFRVMLDTMDRMKRELFDYDARLEKIEEMTVTSLQEVGLFSTMLKNIKSHCFIPVLPKEDDE